MNDLLNLNRLIYFTTVQETGSFTAAGDRLGVAKAVVSHQVAMLEKELGVTLLTRTTRRLRATEEGRLFYERCTEILRDAESAYAEVSQHRIEPSGDAGARATHRQRQRTRRSGKPSLDRQSGSQECVALDLFT